MSAIVDSKPTSSFEWFLYILGQDRLLGQDRPLGQLLVDSLSEFRIVLLLHMVKKRVYLHYPLSADTAEGPGLRKQLVYSLIILTSVIYTFQVKFVLVFT